MACPVDGRYTTDLFQTAMEELDLWEALFCAYGAPLGELVVGSIVYAAVGLNIFIRTGSLAIPFVLATILGSTILGQTFNVIGSFAGLVILLVAPVLLTGLVVMWDTR